MDEIKRIPCMRCKHYQVTFDPAAPRGCKLYQFKSTLLPYVLVKQSTGKDCTAFEEKKSGGGNDEDGGNGKKDFNDPKYW
ncbi:MAG: uracil-DNA glycosylase [Rhizobacter sp.]|nr:uracil-DNA glycosylase [Bacteriovorax sp.]